VKIPPLTILKIYAPILGFIALTILMARVLGIPMYELVADPGEIAKKPSHIGLFSQIGNLIWCATAAICLFSASIVRRERFVRGSQRLFPFLLSAGLLSGQLLLDDFFQLHEKSGKILFGSGDLPKATQNFAEMIVFGIYGLLGIAFLVGFRKVILRSNFLFLLLAFVFFGVSTIIDMTPDTMWGHHTIEESAKLLGIFSWFIYFVRFCLQNIRPLSDYGLSREALSDDSLSRVVHRPDIS
jgi:hypothetical protein